MEYNKIIGSNIRYERQLRNMTIEELAEIIGIAPGFLGLIERGQRGTTVKNLCKIAEFFSITVDELLSRDVNGLAEKDKISPLDMKKLTVKNLVDTLSEAEVEFVDATIRQLKKMRKTEFEYNY
ncbi:MAG: helix-turn-helix transcriptional regulator [Clostridiales bacterium]|nr:helix-turn-helix transcriptional regulator [Clostridiales bacterium]MCD8214440.1 helix-turn-helix transcriptional regulator [Clostridiales bacterium]